MRKYLTREDAVFAACKVLDKFGGCKMGPLCPDVGCCEVRDIIDAFPMIEIPEKHGRLIDADALMKQIEHDIPLSSVFEKTMRRYLRNAPAIIPEDVPDNNVGNIPAEEGET